MEKERSEEEKMNKEFMEHLNRVIPYDIEESRKMAEARCKELNTHLSIPQNRAIEEGTNAHIIKVVPNISKQNCMTHKEIRTKLTKRANRSLSQKIRWLNYKWAKGKITTREMYKQEQKLFDVLEDEIIKLEKSYSEMRGKNKNGK